MVGTLLNATLRPSSTAKRPSPSASVVAMRVSTPPRRNALHISTTARLGPPYRAATEGITCRTLTKSPDAARTNVRGHTAPTVSTTRPFAAHAETAARPREPSLDGDRSTRTVSRHRTPHLSLRTSGIASSLQTGA